MRFLFRASTSVNLPFARAPIYGHNEREQHEYNDASRSQTELGDDRQVDQRQSAQPENEDQYQLSGVKADLL